MGREYSRGTTMLRAVISATILLHLAEAAAPVVTKVEPPDWVTEPEGTSLRILVTGQGLGGASVRSDLEATAVKVSDSGTHLFCELRVPRNASPGKYPLQISTAAGTVEAPFAVVAPLAARGRFQGFSRSEEHTSELQSH